VKQQQEIWYQPIDVPFTPENFSDTTGLQSKWYAKFKAGDTSRSIIDSLVANSVVTPMPFSKHEKWFNIDGIIKKDGLRIDSLKIPNEATVNIGWKKSGFLNLKTTPIVEVINTNPNISVKGMSNLIIKKNKSLFQKPTFWGAVGLIGGFIIKSKL